MPLPFSPSVQDLPVPANPPVSDIMPDVYFVVPEQLHNSLIACAYQRRGYLEDEAVEAARLCAEASRHGIRTHNGIKALHLDHLFGSGSKGCTPGAHIEEIPSRFEAAKIWNANKKLGQPTAYRAMEEAMRLADKYGVGTVSVDNAFHYLWGGGYVMEAARRGYIAYTNCTAALSEVVPFGGKFPTLGTNPHSWGFPTSAAVGFPIVIDWATSVVAMGRVQQLAREGKLLPPDAAVDENGNATTDPNAAKFLMPFGAHKGYGLSLINELVGGFVGGSLPTIRNRWDRVCDGEKAGCVFFFQVIHPDAISGGAFASGRNQQDNVKAVIADILGHGNEGCMLPGQLEAQWAAHTAAAGGLLFTSAEVAAFCEIARDCGLPEWDVASLGTYTV
jgi:L-2-hydroxycarboxylate dehydrogenase (NAD+)